MANLLGKLAIGLALQAFLATPSVCESTGVAVKFEKYTRSKQAGVVQLSKRASNPYSVTIDNAVQSYVINVTIGSNSQPFNLILDTGSSDLWVPSTDNNYCEADSSDCPYGTFQPSQSTSFTNTSEEFYIRYGDGTEEVGYYFEDTLKISDLSLTNVTMAVAIASNSQTAIQGIMGIGFTSNEASNSSAREQLGLTPSQPFTYPSVIDNMVSQGKISARAYSLWLDDLNSFTGTILFGGVDSSKYTGPLVALPIQNDAQSGAITSFTVALTSLVVDFGNGKTDDISPSSALPALLDSGTTLTYLPETIATAIGNGVGAVYDQTLGPIANCTIAANNVSFVYGFGGKNGPTISVSLSSLLTPIVDENYDPITYPDGTPICQWGILPADENGVILGDSFLRSAYVVYDLENLEIGLAQTNFNAGQDSKNAKAISSGSIPGVSSTASGATVQQTATGEPRASERTRATSTGTAPIGVATFPLSTTGTVGPSGTSTGSSGSASSTSKNAGISQGSLAGSGMYHVLACVLVVLAGAVMW